MPFDSLLGNAPALARLRRAVETGRPAHAYLFAGPEGVGKRTAALEFAQALGARPRVIAVPEDKHGIAIAQVQEMIHELGFASRERRVFVFEDAHRMSEEAMNACLKTLEEPSPGTVIVLVTHVPQDLLPTIRSRCRTILFFPLDEALVEDFARRAFALGERDARALALLAGGSPGIAAGLAPRITALLDDARDLQERALSGEINPLIETLGKIKDTEQARSEAKLKLGLLAHAFREALLARTGRAPVLATPAFVARMNALDEDDLVERIESVLDHERLIDLNVSVTLIVEDALLRA